MSFGDGNQYPPTRYNGIRTNESVRNTPITIMFGQNRLSWKMVWCGKVVSKQAQSPGGSGLGKGGTQWVYTTSIIGVVCMGAANGLLSVWDTIGRFATTSQTEQYVVPTGGGTYYTQNSETFILDSGVSYASPYSITVDDYGSPGSTTITGVAQVPMQAVNASPGAGQYIANAAAGSYFFSSDMAGSAIEITYYYWRYTIITNELDVIPLINPYQITVNNQPEFISDEGVTYYPSGVALSPVSGTPIVTGTYNPNGGNYLFAAADAGQGVNISYTFKDPNSDNNAPSQLNLTFFNGALGQPVWSFLQSDYPGDAIGYSQVCYIGSSALYLGFTPAIPQYSFEIAGPYQFGGGIVDASPSDCIEAILTDPGYGIGFPSSYLQVGSYSNVSLPVTNGDFESGSGSSTPPGWINQGSPTIAYDTTTQFAGTQSVVLTATNHNIGIIDNTTSGAIVNGVYPCQPLDQFILTGALKQNSGGMTPIVYVQFYDTGNSPLALTNYITPPDSVVWTFTEAFSSPSVMAYSNAAAQAASFQVFTYSATQSTSANNAFAGQVFSFTGGAVQNQGSFLCAASNTTTMTVVNSSGVASGLAGNVSPLTTVYTGAVTTGAYSNFSNVKFIVTGFSNSGNDGTFTCYTSNTSALTLYNGNGVTETHAGTGTATQWWKNYPGYKFQAPLDATTFKIGTNCMYTNGGGASTTQWEVDNITLTQIVTVDGLQSTIRAYWAANNFFISPIIDNSVAVGSVLNDWLEAGQVMAFWSEAQLKFVPLGDTTSIANGYTFQPPTNPIVSLDFDCFVVDIGSPEDPIKITRTPWQNRYNRTQLGWTVRSDNYNSDVMIAQDEASIDRYGLTIEPSRTCAFITTEEAAQWAANLRVQRSVAVVNTYTFRLQHNYDFLEPGDIVEVTDGYASDGEGGPLGLYLTPVRITKIVNDFEKGLSIEAENFPWSIGTAVLYDKQGQLPPNTQDAYHADPGNTVPVIFEAPGRLGLYNGNNLYMFCNGTNSNWGGCQVWVSYDGINYNQFGTVQTPGRLGVTTVDFPAPNPPIPPDELPYYDNTDTLIVNMQQSGAILQPVSNVQQAAYISLSGLVSPGQEYATQNVAGVGINIGSGYGGGPGQTGLVQVTSGTNGSPFPGRPSVQWTSPGDVTGTAGYATATVNVPTTSGTYSLLATFAGSSLNVPTSGIPAITGVQVQLTLYLSSTNPPNTEFSFYITRGGQLYGIAKTYTAGLPTSPTTISLGGPNDLWGFSSLSADQVNDPTFGIAIFGFDGSGPSTATFNVQNVQIEVIWGGGGSTNSAPQAISWSNATAITSNATFATATLTSSINTTTWLLASDFNFNFPFGFVPSGIQVDVWANTTDSSGTQQLTAQLWLENSPIGGLKAVAPVTNSAADYTFGSDGDVWGTALDMQNLNDPSFGVAFQMNTSLGGAVTESIKDAQITIYGESAANLELIAYQDAELTGNDTYTLPPPILRGIYGTTPIDSPAGTTFARLDQASVIYTYDPTYSGSIIFVKFLSFNLYGNNLQSLASVSAYEIELTGVGAGAIDTETGALQTGTVQNTVARMDDAVNAVHGSYGITNIPAGYGLIGQLNVPSGLPQWQPVLTGSVGASVCNLYVIPISGPATANVNAWDLLECTTTSGAITVNFPSASGNKSTVIGIKKASSDTNTITLVGNGADTIETTSISRYLDCLYFASDGVSNWFIFGGYTGAPNDMYIYIPPAAGTYSANQELYYSQPVRNITLPQNLTGSNTGCRSNPTSTAVITLNKNGASIGTISFNTSGVPTITFSSAVTFNGTSDTFSITAPSSPDLTFKGFWVNILVGRVI